MKIGILGSGTVAQTLGAGFLGRGHVVMLGTRDPQKLAEWQSGAGVNSQVGSFRDAAAFGDIVVLATYGMATVDVVNAVGAGIFAGKIVIDTTNPLTAQSGSPELAIGFSDSLGERIQRALPDAHVVKAFNTVGAPFMVDPTFVNGPPDMFICGNNDESKSQVVLVVADFGWNVIDVGSIERARLLEPMCVLWVVYGIRTSTWNHAFKFLHT